MSEVDGILPPGFCLENLDNDPDTETVLESMRCGEDIPTFSRATNNYLQAEHNTAAQFFTLQNQVEMRHQNEPYMPTNSSKTPDIKTRSSENVFATPISKTPKNRLPFSSVSNVNSATRNLNQHLSDTTTPTKPAGILDPLTPTANLKMLISAASPEIRNRENKKKELFRQELESSLDSTEPVDTEEDGPQQVSRKDKSLGLLCLKFMSRFPEYPLPNQGVDVCLDEIAKDLSVERRRIYDIVNVLESVEMVSRLAKNKYIWHGKTNLVHTLARLKALGESQGVWQQLEQVKEYEMNKELENGSQDGKPDSYSQENKMADIMASLGHVRKERSLGIMSQKFLMLFLVSKPKTINLDLAAKILIGENEIDKTESAKYKTKIRRLYDIANILTSLQLIRKVHVTEVRGRKPAFQYVGPEVDNVNDLEVCSKDGVHRPSSKHSMLDCAQNPKLCTILKSSNKNIEVKSIEVSQNIVSIEDVVKTRVASLKKEETKSKNPLTRHASFEQICQVAEEEREKLFSSQPSSPQSSQGSSGCESDNCNKIVNKDTGKKVGQFILVSDSRQIHAVSGGKGPAKMVRVPLNKLTLTPVSQGISNTSPGSIKIATLLQLDSNRSQGVSLLKMPPKTANQSNQLNDEENPNNGEIRRSKRTVQKTHLGNDFEYEMTTKKAKLDVKSTKDAPVAQGSVEYSPSQQGTSQQDAEVERINKPTLLRTMKATEKPRPSPLRALHLEPEFSSSPPLSQLPIHHTPSPDAVTKVAAIDYELASPLPSDGHDEQQSGQTSAVNQQRSLQSTTNRQWLQQVYQFQDPQHVSPVQYKHTSPPMILQSVGTFGGIGCATSAHSSSLQPLLINTTSLSPHCSPPLLTPNSPASLDNSSGSHISLEYPLPQLAQVACSPELHVFPPSISQVPLTVISPTHYVVNSQYQGLKSYHTPQASMVRTSLTQSFNTPNQSGFSRTSGTPYNQITVTPNTFFRSTPGSFVPMSSVADQQIGGLQMTAENIARRLTLQGAYQLQQE